MILQTPKATLEVKDLRVDISKNGNAKPSLFIKLLLSPITAQMGEQRISNDELSNNVDEGYMGASQSSIPLVDQPLSSLNCEELSLSCEFGHSRLVALSLFYPLFFSFFFNIIFWVVFVLFWLFPMASYWIYFGKQLTLVYL